MIRIFRVYVPASTFGLFLFEALLILSSFLLSADLLLEVDPTDYFSSLPGLASVALVWLSFLLGIHFQSLYSQIRVRSRMQLLQQLLMVAGVAFLLQALISAVVPDLQMPLRVMLLGSLLSIAGILADRLLFSAYVLPRVAGERLLLIGDSPLLGDLASQLARHPQSGIQIAGYIGSPASVEASIAGFSGESRAGSLEESIQAIRPSRVVVGFEGGLRSRLAHELLELQFSGHAVEDAAGTYEKICIREGLSGLNATRLLYSKEFEPGARALFFQTIGNCLIAAAVLALLSPVLALIALLLRLSSGEGVLDRQVREGCNGPFTLYRFRVGAGAGLGRILTRTGLYALPQFIHVLGGQMSIVGPRPERPEFGRELSRRIPFYPHRLNMRPGITGWSQIHMRHLRVPWDSMVELEHDLYYIKYFTPTLDLFVIAEAIKGLLLWGGQP
ncbi:MAG: sugar transferase [Bryobacteraceae bacterium]|jgi:lipopolysaccharide/colanic/teichoic acid biosynthesis glycosyltransferase